MAHAPSTARRTRTGLVACRWSVNVTTGHPALHRGAAEVIAHAPSTAWRTGTAFGEGMR
jgi:hypothetical protein